MLTDCILILFDFILLNRFFMKNWFNWMKKTLLTVKIKKIRQTFTIRNTYLSQKS